MTASETGTTERTRGLTPDEVDQFANHFDHHHPAFGQVPYPVYRLMKSRCPVSRSDNDEIVEALGEFGIAFLHGGSAELTQVLEVSRPMPGRNGQLRPLA